MDVNQQCSQPLDHGGVVGCLPWQGGEFTTKSWLPLRWKDGPVTSWTAEFEWHQDLWTLEGLETILAILERDVTGLTGNFVTGIVTAAVTLDAPSLLPALLAARDRA